MRLRMILALILTTLSSCCLAQTAAPAAKPAPLPPLAASIASHPEWPVAKSDDVKSVDAIVAALYDVISGPAGKPRDWDRFRSLFAPDGRLGIVRPTRPAVNGQPERPGDLFFMTPAVYIERDDPFFKTSWFF